MARTFRRSELNNKGAFTAWEGDEKAGVMSYSRLNDDVVIIDHTETLPAFRGQGVGRELVEHAVSWARANSQQLMLLCPFAKSVFDETPEWDDVRFG